MSPETADQVARLRTRLGRTTSAADQARRALTAMRDDEFRDVPPEDVAITRDLVKVADAKADELRDTIARLSGEADAYRERIDDVTETERRTEASRAAAARVGAYGGARTEPRGAVYREDVPHSFFADLASCSVGAWNPEARDRLTAFEQEQRALNRTDGSGGQFVIPQWLVPDYVGVPRPGRVTADVIGSQPMPPNTDELRLPVLSTGSATAIQTADGNPVTSQDPTDNLLLGPVRTIAGQVDLSLQALEQSAFGLDKIIADDLIADLNQKLDIQVLSGTGSSGQVQGIRGASGVQTVTLSTTSATAFMSKVAGAVSQITGSVYKTPTRIVLHPRRWSWLLSQVDANGRPLVVPDGSPAVNSAGVAPVVGGEGHVGQLCGLPVYSDANIPTNLGAGTNQDQVLVFDPRVVARLWESAPRVRVLPEILSGTLQVRIQTYQYVAQIVRLGAGLALVDGVGLVAPAF